MLILNSLWPQNIDCLIVSAKYGLLTPLEEISYYEQALKTENISKLKKLIQEQIKRFDLAKYSECFVNLSKRYFQSIDELIAALEKQNCKIFPVDKEKRNNRMLAWLAHD